MKALKHLNKYLFKYKWLLLLGVIFLIASNLLHVYMPIIIERSIDSFENDFDPNNWHILAFKLGGVFILLSLGKGIFLFFQRQTIIKVSRYIEFDMKNEIYSHYQKLNYNFFKANSTGDLMNRISEDVSKVRMYLGPGIMYTVNLVILFTFVIYSMLSTNVELTLYTLTPLPLMSYLIFKVSKTMNRQSEAVQREQSKISSLVQETFSGIPVLKAYSGEKNFQKKFNDSSNNYLKKHMALVVTNAFFMPTITFLIGISTILTIYYGGILSFDAQNELSNGKIVAFIFYINMLTWPFASVGWVTSLIQRAAASQERINEFLNQQPEIQNENTNDFELKGKIEFQNVSYKFPSSGIQAIQNLTFTILPGETLAVLGKTGCGKSTILNLILRQFDPNSGKILIDDVDLKTTNLDQFRNQTGIVPQEVFLFSDSIKNNVTFGVNDPNSISDETVVKYLEMAHVWHNIKEFPKGINTILGERGVNLSGGQKQRISIARALIREPKFLILDDCLSAVDTETEEIILDNLNKNFNINTTLIVSHRVSSIRHADKIIVIDEGKKIEEGTHDELLRKNGTYAEMYRQQLLEEEEKSKQKK